MPVEYRSGAECPLIDEFFAEIADPADVPLLYEIVGYCLQPGYPLHKATALTGAGDNGKTTYLNLITRFLGEPNTAHVPLQSLDSNRFAAADLFRKKANVCGDLSIEDLHSTGQFKKLTGEDMVRCERKFGEPFAFRNRAKLIFSTNSLPHTDDDTDAFYGRWLLPVTPNSFPPGSLKRDENKLSKISSAQELSGLLNAALTAFNQVIKRGCFTGASNAAETRQKWLSLSDSLFAFIQDQCEIDMGDEFEEDGVVTRRFGPKTLKQSFWKEYLGFCREKRLPAVPELKLKARLYKLTGGAVSEGQVSRGDGTKVWRNIRLKNGQGQVRGNTQSTL